MKVKKLDEIKGLGLKKRKEEKGKTVKVISQIGRAHV